MSSGNRASSLRHIRWRAGRGSYKDGGYCDDAGDDIRRLLQLVDALATAGRLLVDDGPWDREAFLRRPGGDVFEEVLKLVEGDPDAEERDLVRTLAGVDIETARRLGF